ncbi:MAG TPA: hypothetical protein VL527_03595 [Dongiaceae bacterium]|jgi:hypothetical protein|nr:hypothetical protein [Dongiaceae bacterium]
MKETGASPARPEYRIELDLRELSQLFNTMDPAPFPEKDLDSDAEEFIVSWAREFPLAAPVALRVHLHEFPAGVEPQQLIAQGVHHYFAYRARLTRLELRRLFKEGRQTLVIGVGFLLGCLMASHVLPRTAPGTFVELARESLTIAGWVAMWRPMQLYLYDWWPVRQRWRLHEKLSRMPVEVRKAGATSKAHPAEGGG